MDWDLREVAGARVTLLVEEYQDAVLVDFPAPSPNTWETDGRGRCTVLVPEETPGPLSLFAEREGVGTSGKTRTLGYGRRATVRLVLFPPARVAGRVLREVGIPALGASVRFFLEGSLAQDARDGGRIPRPLKTDQVGRFEIALDAGHRYWAWAYDGDQIGERTYVYADAGSSQELRLWLPGSLTIVGKLLEPAGGPSRRESVLAWEEDPPQPITPGIGTPGAFLRVSTDDSGRFTLPVPRPGRYAVVGSGDGFASSLPVPVDVDEGNPHPEVTLSLLQPAWISGRLRRESGSSVKNTPIQAVSLREGEPYAGVSGQTGLEHLRPRMEARTGEDGSFRILRLHPLATYTLSIPWGPQGSELRAVARSVPAGTEGLEVLVPEEMGALSVVLEGSSASSESTHPRPLVELWHETVLGHWEPVVKTGSPREPGSPHSGAPVRFRIGDLFPGDRYLLEAWAPGLGPAVEGPWTAKPGEQEIVISLVSPSTLEVEVTDADGRPVPCAGVFCERITECEGLNRPERRITPASGAVRFGELGPGPYRLAAVRGTARSEWREIEVRGGETRTLSLSLEP
ncbi:MAG: carboxypeptidase-like regulatory domain-containing protein [Planctomycetes bacterium]|nr:carboxypeptidase-like regulatory domain-containing protein [Planctomycetota bacterium]